jgi:hypothetical protein
LILGSNVGDKCQSDYVLGVLDENDGGCCATSNLVSHWSFVIIYMMNLSRFLPSAMGC